MYRHIHIYVHVCRGQRLTLGGFFNHHPFYFLSQGVLLNVELPVWLDWTAAECLGSSILVLLGAGITSMCHLIGAHISAGDPNTGLHAYSTSTSHSEPFSKLF